MEKTMGIIGFGSFSQFISKFLLQSFELMIYNRTYKHEIEEKIGIKQQPIGDVASCDIVIYSVPVQAIEDVLKESAPYIKPNALVFDVCSVKVKPIALMEKYLPEKVSIIGLHPLFGPESGKDGIKGLQTVICPVRSSGEQKDCIVKFLAEDLELAVIEKTPEEHDRQMAYIQALNHFIARALKNIGLSGIDLTTKSFDGLKQAHDILKNDSLELFLTIERENPFAKEMRDKFVKELEKLERIISG